MAFSEIDKKYMTLALDQAREAYARDEFPVGAVLTIDDVLIGAASNRVKADDDWTAHAERLVLNANSLLIRKTPKEKRIVLYTTLEPCLMCLGTAVIDKIDSIVYATIDPEGGATRINQASMSQWYPKVWPDVRGGLLAEESFELLVKYMAGHGDSWGWLLRSFLKTKHPY